MENEKKKELPVILIVIAAVVLLIALFILVIIKNPSTRTDFESFEEYKNFGAMTTIDIPENAEDIRYYHRDITIGKQSIYSFVLPRDEDYNAFIEELGVEQSGGKVSEYLDDENDLYKFPLYECFKEVTDDDITEYTVLTFYPQGGGTKTYGIIVGEETRRFIVFYFASIR